MASGADPTLVEPGLRLDVRRRPIEMRTSRAPTGASGLAAVSEVVWQELAWDRASNLTGIEDLRPGAEWDDGHRPQSVTVTHDPLYRVIHAGFSYRQDDESQTTSDTGTDWRSTQADIVAANVDPMEVEPAGMVPSLPASRVQELDWSWDWLGNTTSWGDDATSFYERSIGEIHNGNTQTSSTLRPSALYFATDIPTTTEGGVASFVGDESPGWVEVDYGAGGNVTAMTVHGRCDDAPMEVCADLGPSSSPTDRANHLRASCSCTVEQHYQYRWDELNRLSEARRWDRNASTTFAWHLEVRQRYAYDGANVRTIKQTTEPSSETVAVGAGTSEERIALYVYAGDYEVRGLERTSTGYAARTGPNDHVETQFVVAGARLVWRHETDGEAAHRRLTVPLTDVIQTTAATLDVLTGELVEASTYYPNGARETAFVDSTDRSALEPSGFTGKEGDEEVGATYFGERYLLPRLGRWATPDPLHVHVGGGGESCNSYHYVAGNFLQGRDPLGLQDGAPVSPSPQPEVTPPDQSGVRPRPQAPRAPSPASPPPAVRSAPAEGGPPPELLPILGFAALVAAAFLAWDAAIDHAEGLLEQPQRSPDAACIESGRCGPDGQPRESEAPDSPAELAQDGTGSSSGRSGERTDGDAERSDEPESSPATCSGGGAGPQLFPNLYPDGTRSPGPRQ